MFTQIQNLINEYKESTIQSEAEVRSKLIVPLLGILGYPSYLRAEEFPVYIFESCSGENGKVESYVCSFPDIHVVICVVPQAGEIASD